MRPSHGWLVVAVATACLASAAARVGVVLEGSAGSPGQKLGVQEVQQRDWANQQYGEASAHARDEAAEAQQDAPQQPLDWATIDEWNRGRHLQAPCAPAVSNGAWSGTYPGTPPNSGCSACGATTSQTAYNLVCNSAWYGAGTGYCTRTRTWSVSRSCGWCGCSLCGSCNGCNLASDTVGWSVAGASSCTACAPPAAAFATSTFVSGATWSWACTTPGYYGAPLTRVCSTSSGAFSGVAINCLACSPPVATGAAATYVSSWNWRWDCSKGWFGTSVTRTCDANSGTGAFGGTAVSCAACNPPIAGNATSVNQGGVDTDVWRYRCNAGYFGARTFRRCSTTTGVFDSANPTCSVCNDASGGHYCVGGDDLGGVNSMGKYRCPAGSWGAPFSTLTSPTCSGLCRAGYYCPEASSSPTQKQCGEVYLYCPTGSAAPLNVAIGFYTTPVDVDPKLRTGQAACPAERECNGGMLRPAVDFGATCPNGRLTINILHGTTATPFGPAIAATTPGYTGGVLYSLANLNAATECNLASLQGALSYNSGSGFLTLSSVWAASFLTCANGFTVDLRARRNNDAAANATCAVTVNILEVALPPTFTYCGNVTVTERTGVGAAVDRAIVATAPNRNSAMFYFVNTTDAPSYFPFFLGLCDGLFRSKENLSWRNGSAFPVSITARNDGTAAGIGMAESSCNTWVNVIQQARPPVPSRLTMTLQERTRVGTWVGNLEAVDPDGYAITAYTLARADSATVPASLDPIAVDDQGNITVRAITTVPTGMSSVAVPYTVNVSSAFATGSYRLTVTLTLAPTPPKAFDDLRSLPEGFYPVNTPVMPALNGSASRPGLSITYSVFPTTLFDVSPATGVLYVKNGTRLTFAEANVFVLSVTITDSEGQVGLGSVTVRLTEVNVAAVWAAQPGTNTSAGMWSFTVSEASLGGTSIGSITATDANLRGDAITYRITGVTPMVTVGGLRRAPFAIDGASGAITVAPLTGGLMVDRTLSYAQPYTHFLNVSATDNGSPALSINGTVWIRVINIGPRWSRASYTVTGFSAGALGGVQVLDGAAESWVPYPQSRRQYNADCERTAGNSAAFAINITTGNLTSMDNGSGGTVFDPNSKGSYACNLTVTDTFTGQQATATLTIMLRAVNRPPTFNDQVFSAPALMSGNVGQPLSRFVSDPDLALGVGESFTFAILGGNNDTTFGIHPTTGQLFIANNNTPSFQYRPDAVFSLVINITDAGINGRPLSVLGNVAVGLVPNQLLPTVPYVNLTVPEHAALGRVVGRIRASSLNTGSTFAYSLAAAEANVNRPFPFAVRTVTGSGGVREGEVYVIDDGPIHFSPWKGMGLFRVYTAVVTVEETRAGLNEPLAAQGDLDIYVTWVGEPPFFDPTVDPPAPAAALGAYTFTLSVPEHSAAGTNVTGPIPIQAYTKDPWQTGALRYAWTTASVPATYFQLDPVTGAVWLAPGVPDLKFNTQPVFTLTVRVTDANGRTDTATVRINLVDVNEVATFSGVYDASNRTLLLAATANVSEAAPVGTVFGVVRFTDVDVQPLWGAKRYALDPTPDARFFGINPSTGALFIASEGADWNDQETFTLTVTCTDSDPFSPLTGSATITVKLLQVNRVSVTSFAPASTAPAGSAVLVADSPLYAPTHGAAHDVLFRTAGSRVVINGTGFGMTQRRLTAEGLQPTVTTITATYGPTGTEYAATNCRVYTPNVQAICDVGVGIGRDHVWTLTVATRFTAVSSRRTGYMPPAISAVTRNGGDPLYPATQAMRTDAAGESLIIDAANLGPILNLGSRTVVRVTYGPPGQVTAYTTSACLMLADHTQVRCDAVPGIGKDLSFSVSVGGQASTGFTATTVRYATPAVTLVSAPVLDTRGGQIFNVTGTNMGPVGTNNVVVRYSQDFNDATQPVMTAIQCSVPVGGGHTRMVCTSAPGVGSNLQVRVAVAGQESPDSGLSPTTTLRYRTPAISGITGVGADSASTVGGQQVVLEGDGFGPVTDLASDGTPIGVWRPSAAYGKVTTPPTPLRYAGVQCRVAVAHTHIVCLTAPGTGTGHVWMVTVGGQGSAVFTSRPTSYAAPTVAIYSGPGSQNALTQGNQAVSITGYNFGPVGTVIQNVTYGRRGDEFTATECALTRPHEEVTCNTTVGAGAGLTWFVTIDGQRSVAPATAYGRPIIDSFSGPGAMDASTDGGDTVVLTGRFFSTSRFLESVTYGPSGREHAAANCRVSVDHAQITCQTVAGTGRVLRWLVTVGGQTSDLSTRTTSYAAPTLLDMAPASGPTTGGPTVTLTGLNLGLFSATSRLSIRINAVGSVSASARPTDAAIDAHVAAVKAGGTGDAAVGGWIDGLVSPTAILPVAVPRGNHSVSFLLPEGFGPRRDVLVLVDSVPSNLLLFQYEAPVITNLAPDRLNVPVGQLRLFIEGSNFCSGKDGCGRIMVDGVEVAPRNYTHDRVMVIVADPAVGTGSSTVQVVVGGVGSNTVTFSTPVPAFDALTGQGNWGGGSSVVVESATLTLTLSLLGAPATPPAILQPTAAGPLRSSLGRGTGVPTSLVTMTEVTDLASRAVTRVRLGDAANTVPAARLLQTGNNGVNISVSMDIAGAVAAAGGALSQDAVQGLAANVTNKLKAASMSSSIVTAVAAALGVPASSLSARVDTSSIASSVSTRVSAAGGAMSTRGGQRFFIKAVSSIATVPAADIAILIGGRRCTGLTKTQDGDMGPQYGVPANSPLASQYYTYELACLTPAGVGANLPIQISVPGGTSQANPNFQFSYSAPTITEVLDQSNPAVSYTARDAATGEQIEGIPTLGRTVRIVGTNFGDPALITSTQALPLPASYRLVVRVMDALSGTVQEMTPFSHTHEAIVLSIPPGQGKDIRVFLSVGAQTDIDPVAGGPVRAPTLVRYRRPVVSTIYSPDTGGQWGPTVGGLRMTIVGSNFGLAGSTDTLENGRPVVTIGGLDAPLASFYRAYSDHSKLDLLLPEGWGRDLPVVVTVAGQSSAPGATYTYAPPSLRTISPAGGPTSGRRVDGTPINVTITGSNLGRVGAVELRPTIADDTSVTITVPHSSMLVHNHTHMVFAMPEGAGATMQVVAIVGGQESQETGVVFSYDRPSITSIINAERSEVECRPRIVRFRVDNTTWVNKTVYPSYPGCYPTVADPPYTLRITGESFGAAFIPIRITIGGRSCELISHGHNEAMCSLPTGMGDKAAVIMTVGGRTNVFTPASIFSYDPPVITAIVPNRPDAGQGQEIEVRGANMGPTAAPVRITIGGKECGDAQWFNDNLLRCKSQPDTVGRKNVTITAANRTEPFVWLEQEGMVEFRCKRGFYGLVGETCVECGTDTALGQERGAKCPGDELETDLVVSLPGWWRSNVTEPAMCHPLRRHRALNTAQYPGCPLFVACEPADSCLGANECAPEYTGDRCARCARGFYRVSGECIKCPDSPWAIVIVFCVGAVAALGVAYLLNSKNVNLALLSIGMDWAQVVAMFARTRIRWPALVKQLFLILSAFNLNLELIAPECAIPEVTYAGKWLFIEGLPIFAWLFLLLFFVANLVWKAACLCRPKKKLATHLPVLVATGVVVQRVMYLYITRTTLDVYNCAPSEPPDYDANGKEILYMAWNLDIKCNEPGGTHLWLLPFAVAALAVYVVGLPVLSLYFLYKNKETVKYDQILRAQLTGDDRLTNPNFTFRKAWKALYMNYRPGSWYWEFIIVLRKFLIAFCSLMFRRTPSYQLAMALLVLFIAYVLQVRTTPYLSHAIAVEVAAEHRRKAVEGNSLHSRIQEDMRARAAHNFKAGFGSASMEKSGAGGEEAGGSGYKRVSSAADVESFIASRRTRFQRALLEGRAVVMKNKVVSVLFDYNSAEAVLLASAVLVNLAGICFDSSRFAGDSGKRKEVQVEYDSLTFAILVVMFATIVYWFAALILDIALVATPASVAKCVSAMTKAGDKAQAAAIAAGKAAGVGRTPYTRRKAGPGMGVDGDDPMSVTLTNNPAMVSAAMSGNRDALVLSTSSVGSMDQPPDLHTWKVVQASYVALSERTAAAAREIEKLRLTLEAAGVDKDGRVLGSPGIAASASSPRSPLRIEYAPIVAGGKAGAGGFAATNPLRSTRSLPVSMRGAKASIEAQSAAATAKVAKAAAVAVATATPAPAPAAGEVEQIAAALAVLEASVQTQQQAEAAPAPAGEAAGVDPRPALAEPGTPVSTASSE